MTDDRTTNYRPMRGPSAVPRGFVPEGLDDRSQAIYCLVCAINEARPVGYGLIGNSRLVQHCGSGNTSTCTNHTVPTGRVALLREFQAMNCLATIILSLRDESRDRRQPYPQSVIRHLSPVIPTSPAAA
jgi:hypothetical protein